MHTKETKWQDAPLELAEELEALTADFNCEYGIEVNKAAATIRALVQALEQKIHELDSLEPSE